MIKDFCKIDSNPVKLYLINQQKSSNTSRVTDPASFYPDPAFVEKLVLDHTCKKKPGSSPNCEKTPDPT